jgi:hypothetical protein
MDMSTDADYSKMIVCLANSRRESGSCIAGREVRGEEFGAWVRPVSPGASQEISEEDLCFEDLQVPKILDIITIQFARPQPEGHQQENHVIDNRYYWLHSGTMSWDDLQNAVDDPGHELWLNDSSSTYGKHDRVDDALLGDFKESLYLIRPDSLRIVVAREGAHEHERLRVRAHFQAQGSCYILSVTDPYIEHHCLSVGEHETALDDVLVCVSLAKPFYGYAYKVVATLITPARIKAEACESNCIR